MQIQKIILVIFSFFAGITFTAAQSKLAIVKGQFKENVHAEISITASKGGKFINTFKHKISPGFNDFALAVPVNEQATYKLLIRLMEPAERRMEITKQLAFPLKLVPGKNIDIHVTPSTLDTAKIAGLLIKNDPVKSSVATMKCNLSNLTGGFTISLARVVDGYLDEVSSFEFYGNRANSHSISFATAVKEEGFYYLVYPRWRTRVYLKPSEQLVLNIDAKTGSYDIINGSEENKWLSKWQKLALPITELGYSRNIFQDTTPDLDEYISRYQKLQPTITDFEKNFTSSNATFNSLFKLAIDIDNQLAPISFLAHKNEKYDFSFSFIEMRFKGFNQVPDFYKQFVEPGKFSDAEILKIGEAKRFMNMYAKLKFASQPEEQRMNVSTADRLKQMISFISNDTLKAFFFRDQLGEIEINNLTEFRKVFEPLKVYAQLQSVKKKYDDVYKQFSGDAAFLGKSSYNFSLPDSTGKMVSMKDFKGKVILIDVWATWCGPCKEQMPYLKAIEEEYKGNKDIVFMGISIDKEKDKRKWVNYIKKEGLLGVQLFDDLGKTFRAKYEIEGIPRFLLIDKEGNWIEVRCPRPADKEDLKKYLDDALGLVSGQG